MLKNKKISNLAASVLGLAVALGASFSGSTAQADYGTPSNQLARSWNQYLYFPFMDQLALYKNTPARSAQEQQSCNNFYSRVKSKGEMKIALGIGYYDASEGEPLTFQIYNSAGQLETADFGMNATIDIAYDDLYRQLLVRKCSGSLQLCGFKESAQGVFEKKVKTPEGKKIKAIVEVRHASVTPQHASNVGPMSLQQTAKSDATTAWFFGQVAKADLVVYNGHSRRGGGPDFHPPRLLKNFHANYSWYEKNQPGITRLTTALREAPVKPAAILLMSCNSEKLFADRIRAAGNGIPLVSTNAVPPSGTSPTKGALAGMDAFLRFQCEAGYQQELSADGDTSSFVIPLKM